MIRCLNESNSKFPNSFKDEVERNNHLVVSAIAFATFAASEKISFRALNNGQLGAVNSLFSELLSHLLHVVGRHFL